MAKKKKSPAQIQREINAVLAKRPLRSTVDDEWDVAMDAILEHDPKRAAEIVNDIRAVHGDDADLSETLVSAIRAAPDGVKRTFFELSTTDPMLRELHAARIPIDSHDSDLYVRKTGRAGDIIASYVKDKPLRTFVSNTDGKLWFDVPFRYAPFWEGKNIFRGKK